MSAIFSLGLVVILVIFTLATFAKKSKLSGNESWPFYSKKPLSAPEQILYFRLVKALPDHIVLAQVQLSRLLGG